MISRARVHARARKGVHRRSHKQTVEVRHVNIHPGGQSIVGIVNAGEREAEKVLERLATSDKITIVIERQPDGKCE